MEAQLKSTTLYFLGVIIGLTTLLLNVIPVRIPSEGDTFLEQNNWSDTGEFTIGWPLSYAEYSAQKIWHSRQNTELEIQDSTFKVPAAALNIGYLVAVVLSIAFRPKFQSFDICVSLAIMLLFALIGSYWLSTLTQSEHSMLAYPVIARLYQTGKEFYFVFYAFHLIAGWILVSQSVYITNNVIRRRKTNAE